MEIGQLKQPSAVFLTVLYLLFDLKHFYEIYEIRPHL